MRLGILYISDQFGLERVKRSLPTGHAVIATCEHPHLFCVQALVEGPMMPEVQPGKLPQPVRLIYRQLISADGHMKGLWCHFDHVPDQEWEADLACLPPVTGYHYFAADYRLPAPIAINEIVVMG